MKARLLLIHALSPIHCGTGQAIGGIDLPIAREKPTGVPLIPGSSIKGVLRATTPTDKKLHLAVFGPPTENASDNAGSVQFSDANLVFLPVRSIRGTFAWVTSPYILRRLARDARESGVDLGPLPPEPEETTALVTGTSLEAEGKVVFEDFDFTARPDDALRSFADNFSARLFGPGDEAKKDRAHFVSRACVIHEDVMSILLQTGMEITTRIRLQSETKTVEKGALWSEESLPIESVLAGLAVTTPVMQKDGTFPDSNALFQYIEAIVTPRAVQLGGKASVGRGICRIRIEG
jgi:CRISPR-associated protein Cmr4